MAVRLIALLLFVGSLHCQTIGVQNCNPGNIRSHHWQKWRGAIGVRHTYIVFKNNYYGIRAMKKNLKIYGRKYKLDTIRKITVRWAEISKKATKEQRDYRRKICRYSGFKLDEKLDMDNEGVLMLLSMGIVYVENGMDPYPRALYERVFLEEK